MKRALVAAVGALLITSSARADESPAANTSAEHVAATPARAVTSDATSTAARTDKAAVRKSRRSSADDAANKSEASPVKQVPLKGPGDTTMCRTEYPTGSRIGVRRCYSTSESARDKIQSDIMRHDLQEMRDRQMYEQVQRASVGMGVPPAMQSSPSR